MIQDWHNDEDAYPTMQVTTQVYMARDESKDSGVLLLVIQKKHKHKSLHCQSMHVAFSQNANTWHAVKPIDFYRSVLIREFAEKE